MEPLLKIGNQDNGERLDAVLARTYPQYSRVFFQKFLKKGGATLAGAPREPDYRVRTGETFQVADFETFATSSERSSGSSVPVHVVPNILFEDQALLVIDKPAGLVVHPAPGHRVGTLMDWLKEHLGSKVIKVFTDPERLGLVHRLDKDTSGVLLIAKSVAAQTAVSRQFQNRTVQKTYTAFIEGIPSAKEGIINAPVGRSRKVPTRMAVSPQGKASETSFEVKETFKEVALVNLHPKTGRTHQIRVHVSAIGHPIVGDRTYGAKSIWAQTYGIERPLLHAEHLTLAHPVSGESVTFHAPWPQDFHRALDAFRRAFKLVLITLLAGSFSFAYAVEGTPRKAASSEAARKGPSLASEVRKLKKDVADLEQGLVSLQAAVEKMDMSGRLRDLERAVAELNARAVGTGTSSEELKTQMLDITRRLKSQQDAIEQFRDQLDRLRRQVIQQQSVAPSGGTTAPLPVTDGSRAP
jgi:23S rRNA pseudouridine1911/1915/1917 synthase